jgi:hypothetical protein
MNKDKNKVMPIAYKPITSCKQCENLFIDNQCSTDGFDHMEDWNCKRIIDIESNKPKKYKVQ